MTVAAAVALAYSTAHADIRKPSAAKAGTPRDGIALSVGANRPAYGARDPITLFLELRNVGSTVLFVSGPQAAVNYRFIVRDSVTGAILPLRSPPLSGTDIYSAGPFELQPGTAFVLNVRLDDLVELKKPGSYAVDVSTRNIKLEHRKTDVGLSAPTLKISIVH